MHPTAGRQVKPFLERIPSAAATFLDDSAQVKALFAMKPEDAVAKLKNDVAIQLIADMQKSYAEKVSSKLNPLQNTINTLQRSYMAAQMQVFKDRKFYPDANNTKEK